MSSITMNSGLPRGSRTPDPDRLWDRVLFGDNCWEWQGPRRPKGYGVVTWPGLRRSGQELAHRLGYMLWHDLDDIPAGKQVNHHCDNPPCCRPDHLYLGDHSDNMQDAIERGRWEPPQRKEQCIHGHPFDEANTYVYWVAGKRHRACRRCKAIKDRLYKARRRAAA